MSHMRRILLTRGLFATIDDADYKYLSKFSWYAHQARKTDRTWYAKSRRSRKDDNKIFRMHRFILGISDPLIKVDHRDGNGLNNCRANLRVCTQAQNARNARRSSKNTSGFKGVSWNAQMKKWTAHIFPRGRSIYLGLFVSKKDAAKAYDESALQHYGEFAHLNFPVPR